MAYCLYLRKSRKDVEAEASGAGETLARHKAALLHLAKKLNLTISGIYEEIVSGETIAARPVMQQLLEEIQKGHWEGVLVMEVERLARGNTLDQGLVSQAFQISGTKIITPVKTYDPENEFDEEYFEFGLFMSRREFKTINRRIQRGRLASIQEGKYISPVPPYGYNRVKIPDGKGYTLKPHPEQARVIQLIFRMYTEEKIGAHRIAQELTRRGYKPLRKETWSSQSIRSILSNPVYAGMIKWGERKEIKAIENGVLVKHRPNNPAAVLVPGLHDALIPQPVFQAAQDIRRSNTIPKYNTRTKELKNPLAGLIICGECGKVMQRQEENRKTRSAVWLHCEGQFCTNVASHFEFVEEDLLSAMAVWVNDLKLNLKTMATRKRPADQEEDNVLRLEKERETISGQISRLHDLLEQGVYDTQTFLERNAVLANRLREIDAAKKQLQKRIRSKVKTMSAQELIPKMENVISIYHTLDTAGEKNKLLKTVLRKAIYRKTKGGRGYERAFSLEIYPLIDLRS